MAAIPQVPNLQIYDAAKIAQNYGVKAIVYGGPGMGKTPIVATAPRPILCVSEPGTLSLRKTTGIAAIPCFTAQEIKEFYAWLAGSNDAKQFDTVAVDSLSQQAEIILGNELPKHKDPRQAYGEMAKTMMGYINQLYFAPNKHTYLICKQQVVEENYNLRAKPYFPGQDLNVKVPHLFDLILHIGNFTVPGVGIKKAFRTVDTLTAMARDRSGTLSEYEPTDLNQLFSKVMKG